MSGLVNAKTRNPFKSVAAYRRCVSRFPVPPERLAEWRRAGGDPAMLIALAGRVGSVLNELRGRNLACWCSLDQPCHADVLLQLANGEGLI